MIRVILRTDATADRTYVRRCPEGTSVTFPTGTTAADNIAQAADLLTCEERLAVRAAYGASTDLSVPFTPSHLIPAGLRSSTQE